MAPIAVVDLCGADAPLHRDAGDRSPNVEDTDADGQQQECSGGEEELFSEGDPEQDQRQSDTERGPPPDRRHQTPALVPGTSTP